MSLKPKNGCYTLKLHLIQQFSTCSSMGDKKASFEPRSRNPTIKKKAHNLHLKKNVKSMLCFDIGFFFPQQQNTCFSPIFLCYLSPKLYFSLLLPLVNWILSQSNGWVAEKAGILQPAPCWSWSKHTKALSSLSYWTWLEFLLMTTGGADFSQHTTN